MEFSLEIRIYFDVGQEKERILCAIQGTIRMIIQAMQIQRSESENLLY